MICRRLWAIEFFVCSVLSCILHTYSFDCVPLLAMFFSSFRSAYNQRRLIYFSVLYRKVSYYMTLIFSFVKFCGPNYIIPFTSASRAHSVTMGIMINSK